MQEGGDSVVAEEYKGLEQADLLWLSQPGLETPSLSLFLFSVCSFSLSLI